MPADDVLAAARRPRPPAPHVPATPGLWVEHLGSEFVGVVTEVENGMVALRDDAGLRRLFELAPRAYRLVETGTVVTLVRPVAASAPRPSTTASGAVMTAKAPARVARADRILVEGVHDAELLEKIWGDELRPEGVVVEPIDGVDHLGDEIRRRRPGPSRRIGVLLDHLVPGSKESRLAATVAGPHVLVTGHEFVDVWQTVRPSVIGLREWPEIPRGVEWKAGICAALGAGDPGRLWRRLLGGIRDYRDLEPSLVGAVERLLDFVLEEPAAP